MKTLIFIINSLKHKSGSERVAVQLANHLVNCNYNIVIINRDTEFASVAYPLDNRIKVLSFTGNLLQFYRKIYAEAPKLKADKVIIHNMGRLTLLCSLVPSIGQICSLEHISFRSRRLPLKLVSRVLYQFVHQVITLTKEDAKDFEVFHNNIIVIPNFTSFPIYNVDREPSNTIVTIGRFEQQKNYLALLKAWKLIYQKIPNWSLKIYGEGSQEPHLRNYIILNELSNVYLCPPRKDIEEVYIDSKLFVMSSQYEGLPMVLIEAQTFGLPIISFDCPHGPKDVINHKYDGFLVEDQNISELASTIFKLASSPELLQEFSGNAKLSADRFQANNIIQKWLDHVIET